MPHPDAGQGEPELLGDDRRSTITTRRAPIRTDRFSSFRAGFEIRTLRRCHRVLMFHHFAELGGPTLVRSTDLAPPPVLLQPQFMYRTRDSNNGILLGLDVSESKGRRY